MLGLKRAPAADRLAAQRLYDLAVERSRAVDLYAELGVPDTVEGRFELLTALVILIVARLAGEGPAAERVRQSLFDLYVRNLDGALREMGVGDLAVPKRMKDLAKLWYGRAQAYDEAFAALPDRMALEALVERTILSRADPAGARRLADRMLRERGRLAGMSLRELVGDAR